MIPFTRTTRSARESWFESLRISDVPVALRSIPSSLEPIFWSSCGAPFTGEVATVKFGAAEDLERRNIPPAPFPAMSPNVPDENTPCAGSSGTCSRSARAPTGLSPATTSSLGRGHRSAHGRRSHSWIRAARHCPTAATRDPPAMALMVDAKLMGREDEARLPPTKGPAEIASPANAKVDHPPVLKLCVRATPTAAPSPPNATS
jgi:hypothetical protein